MAHTAASVPTTAYSVIAATFAGIEGKRRSVEAGGQGRGGFGVEFADELPCFGVKSGVGAWSAGEWRLVDEDDLGEREIARDSFDGGGVVGELEALGE